MATIHAIRTGLVKVKLAQMEGRGKGLARTVHVLTDDEWSDWLPIYAWVIDHPEGIIVVDTGETARVHEGVPPQVAPVLSACGAVFGATGGGNRAAASRAGNW